ncbi:MAG: FAD-dependent oxidoreductase [Candidatus Tectomicrobia bacterium]|nr:FAD-dependent oxidoreductase [Candidatus Tectomicrobia bacterium]
MARTPLFDALHRALQLARLANRPDSPPADELVEMQREAVWTRRHFLRTSMASAFTLASGDLFSAFAAQPLGIRPRIVIVGAGIAGLNAAYKLKKAGLHAEIYEASTRVGGRIFTAKDIMAYGLTTELGGEFIDSHHKEMLRLAREFEFKLIDTRDPDEASFIPETYFFNGQHYTEKEVIEAFRPIAARIESDLREVGKTVNFKHHNRAAMRLDHLSLSEYFEKISVTGWLRQLLDVAYITEYGLDSDQQSPFNLLSLIGTDLSKGVEIYGESDERFKIKGGNQRLVDELASRLQDQLRVGYRLEAIKSRGKGFLLTFQNPNGLALDIDADFVVICIPFSLLRSVAIRIELPDVKRKAIHELGYGTSAKVMAGFHHRLWRDLGYTGNIFTDKEFQSGWDNSRRQGRESGGLTFLLGGTSGVAVGTGPAAGQASRLMAGAESAFPGLSSEFNGNVARFHWPSFPFALGSYACYKPGQWTTIAGSEIEPVGHLFFAGEHCSEDFQGFMNGAAETGKAAAHSLLSAIRSTKRVTR